MGKYEIKIRETINGYILLIYTDVIKEGIILDNDTAKDFNIKLPNYYHYFYNKYANGIAAIEEINKINKQ